MGRSKMPVPRIYVRFRRRTTYEHTIRRTKNRLIIDTPTNTMGDIASASRRDYKSSLIITHLYAGC
jgi:hypothetical protein